MTKDNFNKLARYCSINNIEAYITDDYLVINGGNNGWMLVPSGSKRTRYVSAEYASYFIVKRIKSNARPMQLSEIQNYILGIE